MGKNGKRLREEKAKKSKAVYQPIVDKKEDFNKNLTGSIATLIVNSAVPIINGDITEDELIDTVYNEIKRFKK